MKTRTYFSAIVATVLMALSTTPAVAQHTGRIEFIGAIVSQGCGTAKHSHNAYSAQAKLNFDLQLNDCLSEIQSVVSVSIDARNKEGDHLAVAVNPQSSAVGVVVSPTLHTERQPQAQQKIYLGGDAQITPLDITYRDTAGQTTTTTDKVYVIVNLSYV